MKKTKLFLFSSLLAVLPLVSCHDSSSSKIEIKREEKTVAVDLTGQELQVKLSDRDDFILYMYDPGCSACTEFAHIFEAYINNNSAILYKIRGSSILASSDITTGTFPEVLAINDGKIVGRTQDLQTAAAFTSFVEKYAFLSSRIRIDEETLDRKIAAGESFIVEYTWDKCGDCNSANSLFIDKYIAGHTDQVFYELELSYYYDERENSSDPIWTDMTAKYKLSKAGSAEFGWNNGVVPTFQYYDRGTLSAAAVLYNDNLTSKIDDAGTTIKVTVDSGYFSDSPFVGQSFEATESDSASTVYKVQTSSFYEQKMTDLFQKLYQ